MKFLALAPVRFQDDAVEATVASQGVRVRVSTGVSKWGVVFAYIFAQAASANPALTPDQEQAVLNLLQSENLALTVARSLNPKMLPAKPTSDAIGKQYGAMLKYLQTAIEAGDCIAGPGYVADGPKGACPVSYAETFVASPPQPSPSSSPSWSTRTISYRVPDPAYLGLNSVAAITGAGGSGGLTVTSTTDAVEGIVFSGGGEIVSEVLGTVPIATSGTGSVNADLDITVELERDLRFPAFTAAFVTSLKSGGGVRSESFSINGQALTVDQLQSVLLPSLQPRPKAP